MIYIIEKHLPGIFNTIDIYNHQGEVEFSIDSQLFLGNRKMVLSDNDENEIASISRLLPSLEPKYSIVIEGVERAKIIKRFTFFEPEVEIVSGYSHFKIVGDIIGIEFTILDDDNQLLVSVSDSLTEDESTYGIELSESTDPALVISILIVLDLILNT